LEYGWFWKGNELILNRDSDITMMATSNSQERDEDDWVELFRGADERFRVEEIKRMEGAKLELIVVRWD
jgi:hypothetical protein